MWNRDYLRRIERAEDYVQQHLREPLTVEDVAKTANFSTFHFHRIFTALRGESLYQYILRLRLERAANLLAMSSDLSVTEIAFDTGFQSSAVFARAFRKQFGMTASAFRKICKAKSKEGKDLEPLETYLARAVDDKPKEIPMTTVKPVSLTIERLEARNFAYIRHVGPYCGDEELFGKLFAKLGQIAGPRGYFAMPGAEVICAYHDDPSITAPEKLRISTGVTLPETVTDVAPLSLMKLEAGMYVRARFEIHVEQYPEIWNYTCGEWLEESGYVPEDGPMYEVYLNDPNEDPDHIHRVELRMCVRPR